MVLWLRRLEPAVARPANAKQKARLALVFQV